MKKNKRGKGAGVREEEVSMQMPSPLKHVRHFEDPRPCNASPLQMADMQPVCVRLKESIVTFVFVMKEKSNESVWAVNHRLQTHPDS